MVLSYYRIFRERYYYTLYGNKRIDNDDDDNNTTTTITIFSVATLFGREKRNSSVLYKPVR